MKRFLVLCSALLLIAGVADAHKVVHNPADEMNRIIVPVFNTHGGPLDQGDVVIWDAQSGTGQDTASVNTTETADSSIVAGVVESDIAAGAVGNIVIWGLGVCDVGAGGVNGGGPLCTATTRGDGEACTATEEDKAYAVSFATGASTQVNCFINPGL